jgi:hypothetical protein
MCKRFLLPALLFSLISAFSQEVNYHVSNWSVYDFLDEMANEKLISLNSAIKPYSRIFIAEELKEIYDKRDQLNSRQQKELDFFLQDFNKELKTGKNFKRRMDMVYYKDSLFSFTLNPIAGAQFFYNDSGLVYDRWIGAEAFAYIGKHLGIYARLTDHRESQRLSEPAFLTLRPGANYILDGKAGEYDETRGGIIYSWDWGSIGLVKDQFVWGDNYHGSNIFSGRQPSFGQIKFHITPVKWFDFNYINGFLISGLVDSSQSYLVNNGSGNSLRTVYHSKYLAANMFTFTLFKGFNFSLGNSAIYSDYYNPVYLIPVLFYKSVDHSYNNVGSQRSAQNCQFFFNLSSRQIKNVHLYSSLFVDEIGLAQIFSKDQHNYISIKAGSRISNILNKNISFTLEYTRTNPLCYQNEIPEINFESNNYNMGNYLADNSGEIFMSLSYKPIQNLLISLSVLQAKKGKDYLKLTGQEEWGLPYLDSIVWKNQTISFSVNYNIINDGYFFLEYSLSDIIGPAEYTPSYFQGIKKTISVGAVFGF